MSELLPCPFCGGEAVTVHDEWTVLIEGKEDYRHDWYVGCDPRSMLGCMGSLHNMETGFDTEEQAIAAWNTRAGIGIEDVSILLDELGLSERTCCIMPTGIIKLETVDCYECSECHEAIQVMEGSTVHYCPNCGSKVVE